MQLEKPPLRDRGYGRWPGILAALGVPAASLNTRKHHPCPWCGGKDRFRFTDKDGTGAFFCGQCGRHSAIDYLMHMNGWDFARAAKEVEGVLGEVRFSPSRTKTNDASARNPRKLGVFKTKHLNLWVQARNAYFDIQKWRESADPSLKLEDFRGKPCKVGLDLASTIDIAAMELTFEHEGGYARFGRYYLPEATIELPENGHYRGWRDAPEQWITQTDGDMIDYVTIRDDILGLQDDEGLGLIIDEIAFDPHQAHMMMAELREEGIPCIEVRPLVLNFSPAMKQMDGLIRSRKIAHNGDPVFTWMLSNVVAKADAKDNVYPRKDREQNKIDGPVAHMMAQARWMLAEGGPDLDEFLKDPVMYA